MKDIIKKDYSLAFEKCFDNYLDVCKKALSEKYINKATLQDYDALFNHLIKKNITFKKEKILENIDNFFDKSSYGYTKEEVELMCESFINYSLIEKLFIEKIQSAIKNTLSLMPSKKAYLIRIAEEENAMQ